MAPEAGTGWHRHEADFQIVIMLKGWARFMYEDKETLVSAGDVRAPAPRHPPLPVRLFARHGIPGDRVAADFKSVDVEPVCAIPAPTPWSQPAAA
jgi:hypothetical protein